jgi:hypothetical protein
MLHKYSKQCCAEPRLPTVIGTNVCCPRVYVPPQFNEQGEPYERKEAIPESMRVRSQLCASYVRPGRSSATCIPGGDEGGNPGTANIGAPGTDAPVEVRTLSASEYLALQAAQTLNAASNATNPDARFQQYFPESIPAPLRVVCPERYPNPARLRDRFCVPQGVFASSVPQ